MVDNKVSKKKIAIVVSHPIQHFCPQYASLAKHPGIELKVFFASALGLKNYIDPGFKKEISWGNLGLDQFGHVFMNGEEVIQPDKNLDAPKLDAYLAAFTPDLVIIYGYFQKVSRHAHRWAVKNRIPLGYISDSEYRQGRTNLKELIKYPFIRWYFSKISYFFSVGDANEDFYKRYGVTSGKIVRMHFPIDIKAYSESFNSKQVLRDKIRVSNNIGSDAIVASVVGKLVSWKNQDHIIKAMKLLEDRGVHLHLFIVGSGDMQKVWEEEAKGLKRSTVHFTGFIGVDELPAYYAASDFYIHPASVEPHSIAVSEAIYMGLPIVISDRCGSWGPSDDVQVDSNGSVYPFGNIESLADKIAQMISDQNRRNEMGERSHQFSEDFQKRSHGGFITELLEKHEI